MKKSTKEDFIAQRYVSVRKQIWLYKHMFLANDSNTNSGAIIDRNLTVINAVVRDLWWVISFSIFQSIFSVLGDMFDVRYGTKGAILDKKKKSEGTEEALLRQLKLHQLGHYNSLVKKLYLVRDKYIDHTDEYTKDNFPIKLKDMNRLEKFLDEVEKKILREMIKDTSEYYFYKQERCDDDILQQFDHLMNVLYIDYYMCEGQMDEVALNKRELVLLESLKRRQKLLEIKQKED
jgi:hypothetical protein